MGFTRTIEDFTCEHCGEHVLGNGYTNHCPECLWSKHVDINPGDRAETCGGLMRPTALEGSSPDYTIVHMCERCEAIRRVKTISQDNLQALVALAQSRT